MTQTQEVQPAFVPYRAGDLRKAFKAQIDLHRSQAEMHPMGPEGLHESLKRRAERSLEAIDMQTKNDSDFLIFPTVLSDFAQAAPMTSFLDYHNRGCIGVLTAREALQLGLTRSLS